MANDYISFKFLNLQFKTLPPTSSYYHPDMPKLLQKQKSSSFVDENGTQFSDIFLYVGTVCACTVKLEHKGIDTFYSWVIYL